MKGQMRVIRSGGKQEVAQLAGDPELSVLQAAVGGYLEAVPFFDTWEGQPAVVFCNEEGKLNKLPYNRIATAAWYGQSPLPISDVLVGDVVILTGDRDFMLHLRGGMELAQDG